MIEDDTWYRCTVCGREGRVGRCCGDETRIPLNKLAIEEQKRLTHRSSGQAGREARGRIEVCNALPQNDSALTERSLK